MSKTSTFAIGLGSGLALWHLTKTKDTPAASPVSSSPSQAATASAVPSRRNCVVRVARTGLMVGGARVDVAEAVRRCQAAGRVAVTVAPSAPASTYAELMSALAHVATVRNAGGRKAETVERARRYGREGRTILREGEAILRLERVDLGDARFAISPYHADLLVERIVRLLNKHGERP
ncbi:MAG: hypothetical protein ACTHU0_28720 [Kofleriaceae bacterium]